MIWQMCIIVIILTRLVKILLHIPIGTFDNVNIQFLLIGILEKYINA